MSISVVSFFSCHVSLESFFREIGKSLFLSDPPVLSSGLYYLKMTSHTAKQFNLKTHFDERFTGQKNGTDLRRADVLLG